MTYLRTALLLLAAAAPLFAWTDASERRIAQKAAQLAPPDLRLLLERFAAEYEAGRADAAASEASHRYDTTRRSGGLKPAIEREVASAIRVMRSRGSTREFVRSLGTLAHLVADANHPFHVGPPDGRLAPMQSDFEGYLEARAAVIPTIFYGLVQPFQLSSFLDASMVRSASYTPLLSEEYFGRGASRTAADFDDRSTAFGIAALSHSHAVTDLVNVYYHVWQQAGGDVRAARVMRKGTVLRTPSAPEPVLGTNGPSKLMGQ